MSTAPSAKRPALTAAADSGYQIDEAEVIFWGTCPECLKKSSGRRETRHQQHESSEIQIDQPSIKHKEKSHVRHPQPQAGNVSERSCSTDAGCDESEEQSFGLLRWPLAVC
jgi:hypothetical protein